MCKEMTDHEILHQRAEMVIAMAIMDSRHTLPLERAREIIERLAAHHILIESEDPPSQACSGPCRKCIRDFNICSEDGRPLHETRFIVCTECGNKRCPKATDHRLDCTHSNEPGQPGSVYRKI